MVTWHAILLPNGMRLSMPTQSCSYCMGGSSLGTDKATTTTTKWQQQQYWHVVQSKSGNTTEFRISLSQDLIEQNKPQNVVRLIHFCIKLYIILTLFTECRRMKASQKIDQLYIFYNVQVKIKFIEINKLLNCCVNETSMHNIMNEILSQIKQVTSSCNDWLFRK